MHSLDEDGVLSAAVIMRKAAYSTAAHVAKSEHRDSRRNILQRKENMFKENFLLFTQTATRIIIKLFSKVSQ